MLILHEIPVKITRFHVFTWKSIKKLESHARVDFTGGCKSIVFSKVLGGVFPPWGGILQNYPIFVEMGGIPQHFMKMGSFYTIFSSVGWKWCPGGPGVETSTKPKLFLCLFRGPGHRKVRFGVDFHQKRGFGCFFGENHQNGWHSAEFHNFHQISRFRAFPAARAPKRAWNLHVLQRVWQGPPGTGVNADFT